jgi:hypothetical protein
MWQQSSKQIRHAKESCDAYKNPRPAFESLRSVHEADPIRQESGECTSLGVETHTGMMNGRERLINFTYDCSGTEEERDTQLQLVS